MESLYPWQKKSYQHILHYFNGDRVHHALLLQIIKGNNSEALLRKIIKWLMCLQPNHEQPCEHCHNCQLMHADTHPDFYIIQAEENKNVISIDAIRKLSAKVYERAQQGYKKVIWIKTMEQMTEAAANALLKTLEEPPSDTYFFLSCYDLASIKATIKSRCIIDVITPPLLKESVLWLALTHHQYDKNQLITALKLSSNAPLAAQQLLQPHNWENREKFCQKLLEAVHQNDYFSLLSHLNYDDVTNLLFWISTLINDSIKYQMNTSRYIINRDQSRLIKHLALNNVHKLFEMNNNILHCRIKINQIIGVNKELLLANLLISLEKAPD